MPLIEELPTIAGIFLTALPLASNLLYEEMALLSLNGLAHLLKVDHRL